MKKKDDSVSKTSYYFIDSSFDLKKNQDLSYKRKSRLKKLLLENFINVGYYLLFPIILGLIIGIKLSENFKEEEEIIKLFFLFLGVFASFYNLLKLVKRLYDRD